MCVSEAHCLLAALSNPIKWAVGVFYTFLWSSLDQLFNGERRGGDQEDKNGGISR